MNPDERSEAVSQERTPVSPRPLSLDKPPASFPDLSLGGWHFGDPSRWLLGFWTVLMLVLGLGGNLLWEIQRSGTDPYNRLESVFIGTGFLGMFTLLALQRLEQRITQLERRLPPAPDLEPTDQLQKQEKDQIE